MNLYGLTNIKLSNFFSFVEIDELPFSHEEQTGDDDIPTLNDILAASFVNVRFYIPSIVEPLYYICSRDS